DRPASEEPHVVNGARGDEPDVQVSHRHRDEAGPRPTTVIEVQSRDPTPETVPRGAAVHAGVAIQVTADDMAEGMAREGVSGQQDDVHQQDQGAQTHAETTLKEESVEGVVPEEEEDNQ